MIGTFFIAAALRQDPSRAKGTEDVFFTLANQPYGSGLLGLVATGFIAYAIYCFANARYRRFH